MSFNGLLVNFFLALNISYFQVVPQLINSFSLLKGDLVTFKF